jgi:hypothetical protein
MCDGPPDVVGPAERLKKLEESLAAWKSPVGSQPVGFPYSKKVHPPFAQSGNLVMLNGPWNGDAGLFGRGEFLMLRFASETRGIPELLWYLDLGCERIEAIALDDSQDLIVFSWLVAGVKYLSLTRLTNFFKNSLSHIHVRTLSGCIHPLSSTLGLIDSGTKSVEYFSLCIHDDRLAFISSVHGHRHVLVWDWKTGKQVAKIASLALSRNRAIY